MEYNRRKFIKFLGKASLGAVIVPPFLASCGNMSIPSKRNTLSDKDLNKLKEFVLSSISPSDKDDLILSDGLDYKLIIKWGDKISEDDTFGFNNDFTCFIPLDKNNPKDGLLWVNHEYVNPLFVSGYNYRNKETKKTKDQVDKEMYDVGGSIIRIKEENGTWKVIENDPLNRRINAKTPIVLNWDEPIKGKKSAIGTLANCSGGITPWNTFLTCEENYDGFFGETIYNEKNEPNHKSGFYGWEKFYNYPPEHYGWVVEINPINGDLQKHIALGRFAHECCTLYELEDKRVVAYSGDDANDEFLYKFISSKPGSLKEGTLYVANVDNGKWISLDWNKQATLQNNFKNQTEVLIRVREAARMLGATPLNRPEDIEIDPISGNIFVSLTNNKSKNDFHGSIMKIIETDGKFDSLTFKASTFKAGGEENGFSCPDNLAFDFSGNLWFTSDISGSSMNKKYKPYMSFKNNGLFVIPRYGKDAGKVMQVASAPRDAELTGPWFSPDGETLFLSVQHPGDQTKDINNPTSIWPFDKDNIPKPAVVAIKGNLIEKMNNLKVIES